MFFDMYWTEVHRKNLQFVTSRNIWASFSGDPHGIWHQRRGGHFRRPNCGYLWWGAWLNNCGMSHLVWLQVNSSPWSSRRLGRLVNSSPNRKFNWSTRRQMSSHWNCMICVFGNKWVKCLIPGVWCDMWQFLECACGFVKWKLPFSTSRWGFQNIIVHWYWSSLV